MVDGKNLCAAIGPNVASVVSIEDGFVCLEASVSTCFVIPFQCLGNLKTKTKTLNLKWP